MTTTSGRLFFVTGKSQSGKSNEVFNRVANKSRVLVWDSKEQFYELPGFITVRDPQGLANILFRSRKHQRIAYIPPRVNDAHFDVWAHGAFMWIKHQGPAIIVAEELADVTQPGKAPGWWGECCRKLLGYGADIYAVTQRAAESDKTAIGNATDIICFALARANDRKYMANELDCSPDMIPKKNYQYLHRDIGIDILKSHSSRKFTPSKPRVKKQSTKKKSASATLQSPASTA